MALEQNPNQNGHHFAWWRLRIKKGVSKATNEELEGGVEIYEDFEIAFAGVVIAGVLFEFFVAFIHPEYDSPRGVWGPVIGDALVAIGLVVEIVAGIRIKFCQGVLLDRTKKELSEAKDQAVLAFVTAGGASSDAASAQQDAAKARRELAEAIKQVEEERSRRIAIEAQLFRGVAAQINNREFIQKMSEFNGLAVDMVSHGITLRVDGFANLLTDVLTTSHWSVTRFREPEGSVHFWVRVVTKRGADERTLRAATAFRDALSSPDFLCSHIVDAGGAMVDFAKPLTLPNGEVRDASKNAPIRILVGGRKDEIWVRPEGQR